MPLSNPRRIQLARTAVVLGTLAALLVAPRLWLEHRYFGPLPVFSWVPVLHPPLDLIALTALALLLLPVLAARRPRPWILLWCALFALRSLPDRITWQPYFLQYFFLLLALAFAGGGGSRDAGVLHTSRLVVASIYFWSGVSKFDHAFLHGGIVPVLHPISSWFPPALVVEFAILVPAAEVALALGLLVPRMRDAACALAILMHLSLLYVLGPLGQDYNRVVWPWNVVMIALDLVLFFRDRGFSARDLLWPRGFALHRVALVLFVVCPVLSYAGLWDPYLSFRLYSYKYHWGTLYLGERVRAALPERTRVESEPSERSDYPWKLLIPYWSEHELGAFAPATPAVYRGIARKVCAEAERSGDVLLVIDEPGDWRTGASRRTSTTCDGLR